MSNPKINLRGTLFTGKVPLRSRFGNSLTRLLFTQIGVAVSIIRLAFVPSLAICFLFMLSIEGQRSEYEMNMLPASLQHYPIVEVPIETVYINDNKLPF